MVRNMFFQISRVFPTLALFTLTSIGAQAPEPPPPVDMQLHTDITYYSDAELVELGVEETRQVSLDIYEPLDGESLPIVAYVHGGSWYRGDKQDVGHKPDFFVAEGFVLASVNYRLRPSVELETLQQDVARAVAWLHSNAVTYRGDGNNIFLLGHSAGAHQVSIVGTRSDLIEAFNVDQSVIRGVIELDTMALDVPLMMKNYHELYGPIFGADPDVFVAVSPYHHIKANRYTPPFLFIVADQNDDKLMQSKRMAARLHEVDVEGLIVEAKDRSHITLNKWLGGVDDPYGRAVVEFIQSQ